MAADMTDETIDRQRGRNYAYILGTWTYVCS